MNRFELLHVAKAEVRALAAAGYRPPLPPRAIPVAGAAADRDDQMMLDNMRAGGFISEHDYLIGCKVATVMCGGDVEGGSLVDEQWFLDLERQHFMELLGRRRRRRRGSSTCSRPANR